MRPASLMVDIEGLELTSQDRQVLQHPLVGGLILFSRNYSDPSQLQALTQQIHAIKPELIIAVDQEGGRVQRFKMGFTELPPASRYGKLYDHSPEQALQVTQQAGWLMATELLSCGVDLSFAPVLDLQNLQSRVIGDRAFHADPNIVALLAGAFMRGMQQAGMAAVGKHFPGHGTVIADSHLELPVDPRDFATLQQRDLLPFIKLAANLQGMMAAHIKYPAIDPNESAGFSAVWLKQILRQQLDFRGIIFSDALDMQGAAVRGTYTERVELAERAGCDVALVCNNRAAVLTLLDNIKIDKGDAVNLQNLQGQFVLSYKHLPNSPEWCAAVQTLESLR